MPSVVDNPPPSSYTFCSELTPFSFASTSTSNATDSGPLSHRSLPPSPTYHDDFTLATALPMVQSRTHGKRREGYIPRPPNAFILFRSAFIRDQNVPGRVEGNHSTLSKIIGAFPPFVLFLVRINHLCGRPLLAGTLARRAKEVGRPRCHCTRGTPCPVPRLAIPPCGQRSRQAAKGSFVDFSEARRAGSEDE